MTVIADPDGARVRSLSAMRGAAADLDPTHPLRMMAEFRADELEYLRDVARAAATHSPHCRTIDATVGEGADKVPNQNPPYITWDCCGTHRGLKARKQTLNVRAQQLGVERISNLRGIVVED